MKFISLPPKSLLIRLYSSSTTPLHTLSITTSGISHSSPKRLNHDEDSRSIKVSVFWNFNNCNIPPGSTTNNVYKLSQSITTAIRSTGIKGPITIKAFGNVSTLSKPNQEALYLTGITLNHNPTQNLDISVITELMHWVSQNPPPAHLFLISTDKEYADVLHKLRMSNYNILLASKSGASSVLCSAASIMWDWDSLVKGGENVEVKYFNQPPDGPYNSWYGHYKVPLLDPFVTEECSNVRPIPKEVVDKIRMIMRLYPNGVHITELRAELFKSDVAVDKGFYGYKRFLKFLQSMPHVLEVSNESKTGSDGFFIVRGVTEKGTSTTRVVDSRTDVSSVVDQKVKEKETTRSSKKENVIEKEKPLKEESLETSKEHIMVVEKDVKTNNDKPEEMNQVDILSENDSSSMEDGIFHKLKRLLYGSDLMESNVSGSGDKDKVDTDLKSPSEGANPVEEVKAGTNEDKNARSGLFSQLFSSFRLWRSNTDKKPQEEDIFTKDSFWKDVESFINSPRGYAVVTHSRTREVLAKNLQKEGPFSLRLLDESRMLRVLDFLISDKKLIVEKKSLSSPFSITTKGSSTSSPSSGLKSIFTDDGDSVGYKSKAIEDCKKLLKKKTEENPKGYSIFRFRNDFLEEYGYILSVSKLSHETLQSLILTMPGVRIAYGYILPSKPSLRDAKSVKEDDSFEELGPVSDLETSKKVPVYEPSVSEDEDSDSERDSLKKKKKVVSGDGDDEDSSLLQILDSYYKDVEVNKEKPDERKLVGNYSRKQKPAKTYSFVKDSEV